MLKRKNLILYYISSKPKNTSIQTSICYHFSYRFFRTSLPPIQLLFFVTSLTSHPSGRQQPPVHQTHSPLYSMPLNRRPKKSTICFAHKHPNNSITHLPTIHHQQNTDELAETTTRRAPSRNNKPQ